jgi:hypothetical protein
VGEERARSLVRVTGEKDRTKQIEPFLCNQWHWWGLWSEKSTEYLFCYSTKLVEFCPTPYFFRVELLELGVFSKYEMEQS